MPAPSSSDENPDVPSDVLAHLDRPQSPLSETRRWRPGDKLKGRYRIVQMARGPHAGLVLEAIDEVRAELPDVEQRVTIHLLGEERSREMELLQRLYRLQLLAHPAIAQIFDIDEDDGEVFLTMEWLQAKPLRALLDPGKKPALSLHARQSILASISEALDYAHSRNTFHGALDAANVMITGSGEVRLQGFVLEGRGLAATAEGDRLAYARLSSEVLKGVEVAAAPTMRDLFYGPGPTLPAPTMVPIPLGTRQPRHLGAMAAVAAVVAIIGLGGYLLLPGDDADALSAQEGRSTPGAGTAVATELEPAARPSVAGVGTSAVAVERSTRDQVDLPGGIVQVSDDQQLARVWVRRRGSLEGPVAFQWRTEGGTAQADRDFAPVGPRWDVIPHGATAIELLVPLVRDGARTQPRVFYVKMDQAGLGAIMGERTLTQVEIIPASNQGAFTAESIQRSR